MFWAVTILILCLVSYLFISRRASPIPYFPSNKKDIKNIVLSLQLTSNQVVYDLGAGDGVVIFAAASRAYRKKLNTKFVAVEINPVLIAIIWLRILIHPNRRNIHVMYGNIFSMRYPSTSLMASTFRATDYTFFSYISPWYLEKVYKNIRHQIPHFSFVSYFYPLHILRPTKVIRGVHKTYIY